MTRPPKRQTLSLLPGSLLAAVLLLPTGSSPAQGPTAGSPSTLANARIVVRSASAGLDRALDSVAAGTDWVGWTVPRVDDGGLACCSQGVESKTREACRLEPDGNLYHVSDPPAWLSPAGDLRILVEWKDGGPGAVVAFAESCPLDAGGQTVLWLEDVDPRDSVGVLEHLALEQAETHSRHHGALGALARHDVAAADDALVRLAAPDRDEDLRQAAIFWLGHSRDRAGFAALTDLLASDDTPEIRGHIAFALTQSPVPEAVDRLARMAREEKHPDVREKSLFWLAHSEDPRAPEILQRALREDPDPEVREHAVFALTQLPGEGTEELIQVARTSRDPEIRKKALFWLGQSHDPRAMEFFEEVLQR